MNAHHKLIRALVAEVRRARAEAEDAQNYAGYQEEAAIKASRRADREAAENDRARQEEESRRWEREQAMRALNHAIDSGDTYGQRRARDRLKRADW